MARLRPRLRLHSFEDPMLTFEKATKLAKEYEKQGGDYENEPGSKNKPKKGEPEKKE